MDAGYNQNEFAEFLGSKKDNGVSIDEWTMEELIPVSHFWD